MVRWMVRDTRCIRTSFSYLTKFAFTFEDEGRVINALSPMATVDVYRALYEVGPTVSILFFLPSFEFYVYSIFWVRRYAFRAGGKMSMCSGMARCLATLFFRLLCDSAIRGRLRWARAGSRDTPKGLKPYCLTLLSNWFQLVFSSFLISSRQV